MFSPTGVSPALPGFSNTIRLTPDLVTPSDCGSSPCWAFQPPACNACRLSYKLGLGSSPFARHYSGNNLSSWRYLDVSVPSVPPVWPIDSASGDQVLPGRVPPFGDPRINA